MLFKNFFYFENFYIKFTSKEISFSRPLAKALLIVSIHANIGTKCIPMLKFIIKVYCRDLLHVMLKLIVKTY